MLQPIDRRAFEVVGASRYHIIADLGGGGMARVELAIQSNLEHVRRLAVIKRVREHLATQSEFVCMFIEEARIAASLSHPNVVHIYEAGHDAEGCFLAMEFLRGQPYNRLLREIGYDNLPLSFSLEVLIATLSGLEYAHELRDLTDRPMELVHRDISPQNVFITYEGQIKVLDFGIAKSLGSSIQTSVGVLKGKVSYMAPEQVQKQHRVDARADLYAVGVMLWEALAGHRRWGAMSDMAILHELVTNPEPISPGAEQRGFPRLATEICLQALAPNPNDRFASAADFRAALVELAQLVGPRPTGRELGDYLRTAFELERQQEQALIERQLQRLNPGEVRGNAKMFMDDLRSSTRIVARKLDAKQQADESQTTAESAPGTAVGDSGMLVASVSFQKKRRRRSALMVAMVCALVLGAGLSIWNVVYSSKAGSMAKALASVPMPAVSEQPLALPAEAQARALSAGKTSDDSPPIPMLTSVPNVKSAPASSTSARTAPLRPKAAATQKRRVRRTQPAPKTTPKPKSDTAIAIDRGDPWNDG